LGLPLPRFALQFRRRSAPGSGGTKPEEDQGRRVARSQYMLLANARLCVAAARTKAHPGSAAYRFQLRHSGFDPVMVGLALTTVLTAMWAVFSELLFSVATQNWLVYAPFADRVAYRGICNSALVMSRGKRFESACRFFGPKPGLLATVVRWMDFYLST
jgi:hypothetical protein